MFYRLEIEAALGWNLTDSQAWVMKSEINKTHFFDQKKLKSTSGETIAVEFNGWFLHLLEHNHFHQNHWQAFFSNKLNKFERMAETSRKTLNMES